MLRATLGLSAAHPPHRHPFPPGPHIPTAPCPPPFSPQLLQELATVTVPLGVFPTLLEAFMARPPPRTVTLMGFLGLEKGESQVWQILGEN